MKSLQSSPLTDEDIDIWLTVVHAVGWPLSEAKIRLEPFFVADRRDAQLMLQISQSRLIPVYIAPMSGGQHSRVVWWELSILWESV